MRKLLVLAALLAPLASQAQVQLGLRLGYAPAMGDAAEDAKMSDAVKAQIPLQLDAAYKVTRDIAVGGYFAYGFGQTGDLFGVCGLPGVDCSARILRVGVQGLYTFNQVQAPLVPWAGVGFGYEVGSLEAKSDLLGKATFTYGGFELLNLQVGGDYRVNERFAVGPYLQLSIAQYSNAKIEDDTITGSIGDSDGDIDEKAMHQWFGFGIRGKFDL
jgi:hypothetical protein